MNETLTAFEVFKLVGFRPFITAGFGELQIIDMDSDWFDFIYEDTLSKTYIVGMFSHEFPIWGLLDYFEEDTISLPQKHICNCDFVKVILVTGCKCGGL
jgi:hypothetical protein